MTDTVTSDTANADSSWETLIGIGFISMAAILTELLLTRLLSATLGYHFAFLIVSLAVFGMTVGTLTVMKRSPQPNESPSSFLVCNSLWTAVSIALALFVFVGYANYVPGKSNIGLIVVTCVFFSLPFIFSGRCVSFCLSYFRDNARLYGFDLLGGALACPALVYGLSNVSAENVFALASCLAVLSAFFFQLRGTSVRRFLPIAIVLAFSLGLVAAAERILATTQDPKVECIEWSPVGRVKVETANGPFVTWTDIPIERPVIEQKYLTLDYNTTTCMFSGNATDAQLLPLRIDIPAFGSSVRPDGSIFVIGAGGGPDIVTALMFDRKGIDAIELNPCVVSLLKGRYANFTRFLYKRPGVNLVNDEARTWLERSNNKYALIQSSMTGSFNSPSAAAFMLTENIVYTKEAFELYLKHLEPHGILSFLRHGNKERPEELLRLLNLAKSALNARGVTDISSHVMLISKSGKTCDPIGALLVSVEPFSDEDYRSASQFAKGGQYEVDWLPELGQEEPFASFIQGKSNLDPGLPSDDCPFYFNMPRLCQDASSFSWDVHSYAIPLLMTACTIALVAVALILAIPPIVDIQLKPNLKLGPTAYFFFIGLGFMQVEMGLIERLTVLLGNRAYGLSVVVFVILLASGLGSLSVNAISKRNFPGAKLAGFAAAMSAIATAIVGLATKSGVEHLVVAPISERIWVAAAIVFVPTFFMGWCLPLGLKLYAHTEKKTVAWLWAINGAASVLGSIAATLVSMTSGITMALILGAGCYAIVSGLAQNSSEADA